MTTVLIDPQKWWRIWLDGLPMVITESIDVLEVDLGAGDGARGAVRSVAIERFRPLGGRYAYGLLGASYQPSDLPGLKAQVVVTDPQGAYFDESLVSRLERVRWGIPDYFAPAIVDALRGYQCQRLGPGVVRFHCGAHSDIGTSRNLLADLTARVMRLIDAEDMDSEAGQLF